MICPKPQKDFRDPIIKTTFVAEENCGCQMGIMFNVKILKMILNLSRLLRLTTQCLILSILPSIQTLPFQLRTKGPSNFIYKYICIISNRYNLIYTNERKNPKSCILWVESVRLLMMSFVSSEIFCPESKLTRRPQIVQPHTVGISSPTSIVKTNNIICQFRASIQGEQKVASSD